MSSGEMRVSPELLERGAGELREHYHTISGAVADIGKRYSELQDVWTGGAANSTKELWSGVHKPLTEHVAELERHATTLGKSAEAYRAQEDSNTQSIASVQSGRAV
ncbi:WXG100 family type VII secretion target [Mycobacteroides franklinii]|uniref:WXG100 family type VII secretion target n=1 Tax=Mycobacteroides franklinii TaxID=948102 RepID=UPI0009932982|nr:WXG100 family type VII secretion target [Mycobacteroides franklinii]